MQVSNVLQATRWKYRTQKRCKKSPSEHHHTTSSGYVFATKACIDNRKKTAEIDWRVWGTLSYFNGYRVLATLLHGIQVVGVSQTLWH